MDNLDDLYVVLMSYLGEDFKVFGEDVPSSLRYAIHQCYTTLKSNKRDPAIQETVQSGLDIVWELLNTGHWSHVPEVYRELYSRFSLLKVLALVSNQLFCPKNLSEMLKKTVEAADLGLLLGSGCRKELSDAATMLNHLLSKEMNYADENYCGVNCLCYSEDFLFTSSIKIEAMECPSLEYFNKRYFTPELPVKLKGCIEHWPALKKWCNMNYIKSVAGFRTVPIELGSSYTHEEWGMKLLTIEQFIENHINSSGDKVGYLAQHQLFDQIPELRKDICIPEYCCLSKHENACSEPDVNAWFGPKGTVTPLHYDPKHNLLAQVVGRKRIVLYSPEDSENLYPYDSKMLHNTARVDPENPDFEKFPCYKSAKCYECTLHQGELLYIPPKWWHFVRSVDISFSVSFWWE